MKKDFSLLKIAAALAILIFTVSTEFQGQTGGANLSGTWRLAKVGGKDPSSADIKSWQISFRDQNKWEFSGVLSGQYAGMTMSGSGTWLLQGTQMQYTAGSMNAGQTSIQISNNSLTFSSDPVIRLNGKDPVETTYVLVSQ